MLPRKKTEEIMKKMKDPEEGVAGMKILKENRTIMTHY
jgi:hypothetical protein